MTNLPVPIVEALNSKSLASKFTHGRFDKDLKWSAQRLFAERAIRENPKLAKCIPQSIATALLDVSYSGLSLSPSLAHGYLIPYGPVCSFSPGYRGLLHLAYKGGTIKSVQSNVVRDSDPEFHVWTDETGRHIKHVENQRGHKVGGVTHSYCIANLAAGGPPLIEVMNAGQLQAVEAAAKRKGGGAVWGGPWRDEMCRKAVIRRASKTWPKDAGGLIEHMIGVSDRYDGASFDDLEQDSDAPEQELCISLDQQTALTDILLNHGIQGDYAPEWLRRFAMSKGYSSIENLPARLFDEAHKTLTERAKASVSK